MMDTDDLRALTRLLAVEDSPDLVGVLGAPRGRRITYGGNYARRDEMKLALGIAHLSWLWQEHDDASRVVSVRRQPLKIARRA